MIGNLDLAKKFWTLTTVFAFLAAMGGLFSKGIYAGLFPDEFLPGAFPQDVQTVLVCLTLFVLIAKTGKDDVKSQVVIMGLLGSFFYLYGIFTIERVYNQFYLLYAAAFAGSFWSIIHALAGFKAGAFARLRISGRMRKTTAIVSIAIAGIFTLLWTMALIPLMRERDRIEYLYSIYILDLCFVMPAFVITAVMSLRRMPLGILMSPAIMILGFFVIFPLGLNELAKPSAGMQIAYGPMAVSFLFAFAMLAIAALHLRKIQLE